MGTPSCSTNPPSTCAHSICVAAAPPTCMPRPMLCARASISCARAWGAGGWPWQRGGMASAAFVARGWLRGLQHATPHPKRTALHTTHHTPHPTRPTPRATPPPPPPPPPPRRPSHTCPRNAATPNAISGPRSALERGVGAAGTLRAMRADAHTNVTACPKRLVTRGLSRLLPRMRTWGGRRVSAQVMAPRARACHASTLCRWARAAGGWPLLTAPCAA